VSQVLVLALVLASLVLVLVVVLVGLVLVLVLACPVLVNITDRQSSATISLQQYQLAAIQKSIQTSTNFL